jgi:tetratricopeptide (TPR) repeat protein
VRGWINRDNELARLDEILANEGDDPHALAVSVITGTAGVGKTSLALRWAHRVRARFSDGQLYVNLRGYDPGPPLTPEYALDHFLRALNVEVAAIPADLHAKASMYRSLVADKRVLVVLDNAATVGQVRPLLPGSASCLVLVTSRSSLPGLAVRDGAQRMTVNILADDDAINLIRVVTAGYRGQDDPAELAELARLCARLPLALRIAAERAAGRPRMPLSELIQDLRDESALWDALSTENDEEADAVRTVFAWSYRALAPEAARLFRMLGMHPGHQFCIAAAAALAGRTTGQVRHLLDALIGANLLEQTGSDCYEFHDLLRAYAVDQAHREESEEDQNAALRRALDWYLHSAAAARAMIRPGGFAFPLELEQPDERVAPQTFVDHADAVRWYETERANLIAATQSAVGAGFDRIAWQIPAVLSRVYTSRDPVDSWFAAEETALTAARRLGDRYGEAVVLDGLGMRLRSANRLPEAVGHHRAALAIFQEIGDQFGEARSLNGLGNIYVVEHRLTEAFAEFERMLARSRTIDHRSLIAVSLTNLGIVCLRLGRLDEAERFLQEAVPIHRELGEQLEEATALRMLGAVYLDSGRLTEARDSLQLSLTIARDRDSQLHEGLALLELGHLEMAEDRYADALVSSQRAAAILRQLGHRGYEARALGTTGEAYLLLERLDDATAFHRQAVAIHRQVDDRWWLAVSLNNLATALNQGDRQDEARDAWGEALGLLADLPGVRAADLRARIDQLLR